MFWNLNAIHGLIWAVGQAVWTYYDLAHGGVPAISPTDPLFFVSSIPLAAALYGRPERDRPRWLFDIVLLDLVLIALFSAFVYVYFVVSIAITDGNEQLYDDNLTRLLIARNLILAVWSDLGVAHGAGAGLAPHARRSMRWACRSPLPAGSSTTSPNRVAVTRPAGCGTWRGCCRTCS